MKIAARESERRFFAVFRWRKQVSADMYIFYFGCWHNLWLYRVGELTHMRSMCVGVAETGVEHCSPAKKVIK